MKTVGFIGLGLMGAPMATNIARAGFPLKVYNRTASKANAVASFGARVVASPKEAAIDSDVVVTMLSDQTAVEKVVFGEEGLLVGASPGQVWIDMSTISPQESRQNATRVAAQRIKMLDAPVMGSTGPAAAGTLIIMVGGDQEVFDSQRDLLGAMGKDLFYMGPQGSGASMKLSMNLMVAAELAALSEAMLMAAKSGLDLAQVGEIIAASNIASNLITRKVPNIVNQDYKPAFPLKHMHKDLGLIVSAADAVGATIPATSLIHQLFSAAKERGHAEEDASALYRLYAELAGLEV
jgi:3-hydroxyisobutyrate dehydrogenase-like beta-hydroxyacid dehydrogenase